jgi:DNA-binding transcriptional ArsR family regulator
MNGTRLAETSIEPARGRLPTGRWRAGHACIKVLFYNRRLYDKRRIWRIVPITSSLIDKQEHIEQAARALKSISHPLRLKILCVIGDQEACVQEIVQAVGTSQSNISQHLAILREKGVLIARKESNRVYYRVGDARTLQLIGMMREVFCGG